MTDAIEGEIVEETPQEPKKNRKKRKDRRVRDKLFVESYIRNGGNATKAALEMTDASTRESAKSVGHMLKKRNEDEIEKRMERYGLTDEKVFKRHAELVDSNNENVAMKAVDTFYKVTRKEGGSDQNVTIHFNF